MDTVVNVLNVIWPYLAVGGGITVVTQILKRMVKLENSAVIRTLFYTITLVTTALTFLLGNQGLSAGLLALHAVGYSGVANVLFPLVSRVDGFLSKLNEALKIVTKDAPAVEAGIAELAAAAEAAQQTQTPAPAKF